jgi:hypothetical protein
LSPDLNIKVTHPSRGAESPSSNLKRTILPKRKNLSTEGLDLMGQGKKIPKGLLRSQLPRIPQFLPNPNPFRNPHKRIPNTDKEKT